MNLSKDIQIGKLLEAGKLISQQSGFQKALILKTIAQALESSKDDLIALLVQEAKKPVKYARIEVKRCIDTFNIASEEATRIPREYISLNRSLNSNKEGYVKRFPLGAIFGITPFNFPLNLVAHKIAPAIAAGCPIIIKPSPKTPLIAKKLIDIIASCGAEPDAVQCIELPNDQVAEWVKDERFKLISFTGSAEVGWKLKSMANKKKVILELGGNAGAIIAPTANLNHAAKRCTVGGFAYSGQVCIHTQRIYIHESQFDSFIKIYLNQIANLTTGKLNEASTDFGPMISEEAASRVQDWIEEAKSEGATLLLGGNRMNDFIEPTVMTNTSPAMKIVKEEVFGPVVVVEKYSQLSDAIDAVNDTAYGLQAGLFTDSNEEIQIAFKQLQVGSIMINDVPTFRDDNMPYGGIKDSGTGQEGVKYAILEMTEPKLLVT
ncbi:MAG: aldehyde dehydrogenase family protein [Crocinitomicaceae bacterium]|nr:aldehyde dehydrogenase family protein [Crocinitomicaceae bacterium]MBT5402507.1 aldehyde dehydrogenase family protein [Crocinitomicaceae bacterium]MBT6030289.1 aldehyde dehydrogenase family protein [Crocinitomicaceae bacterium]